MEIARRICVGLTKSLKENCMRNFLFGFFAAFVVVAFAGFCYVRFGFVDPRADIRVGKLEKSIAMPSLDASIDRRAPDVKNPVGPTDANLIAGMKIYQANCTVCHGDLSHSRAMLADALYPRAPQFLEEDAPDMPEYQNFYIIKHGIRLSGMPAWDGALSDAQMWQVTTFLSHMGKLPSEISERWRAKSAEMPVADSSTHDSSKEKQSPIK
jgi:mono/diheme cytochrome c family protein